MISQEFIKKWNGAEIMFKIDWMDTHLHCAVLVSSTEGVSVKPYYENEEERQKFIENVRKAFSFNSKYAEEYISKSDYCLMYINPNTEDSIIEEILTYTGNNIIKDLCFNFGSDNRCPFV